MLFVSGNERLDALIEYVEDFFLSLWPIVFIIFVSDGWPIKEAGIAMGFAFIGFLHGKRSGRKALAVEPEPRPARGTVIQDLEERSTR